MIRHLLARIAEDGPMVAAFEDLHWADATSLQLLERLLADTETSALLLVLTLRPERDHPAWGLREAATARAPAPHAGGGAGGAVGRRRPGAPARARRRAPRCRPRWSAAILEPAEGNPFFLEEIVRSLVDAGALRARRQRGGASTTTSRSRCRPRSRR